MRRAAYIGDEVLDLLPHRPPMVMVDAVRGPVPEGFSAALTVKEDNIFCKGGYLLEPGIIEHAAQTAAAMSGYQAAAQGLPPSVGYLAEIKTFRIERLPKVGETLETTVLEMASALGMSLISATVTIDGSIIAQGQLKIFVAD